MKIAIVNGKMCTYGSWDQSENEATRQAKAISELRSELRAMLSGNTQFHEDPNSAPTPAPRVSEPVAATCSEIGEWHDCDPPHPGVYVAGRSGSPEILRWWDGKYWSAHWRDSFELEGKIKASNSMITEAVGIKWLRLITTEKPGDFEPNNVVECPAIWRTAADIPQSEREDGSLWYVKLAQADQQYVNMVSHARLPSFNDKTCVYLKASPGTKVGQEYNPDDYLQPSVAGWFRHDPKPDSKCPVPSFVKEVHILRRDGSTMTIGGSRGHISTYSWSRGHEYNRDPHKYDFVGWKVAQ